MMSMHPSVQTYINGGQGRGAADLMRSKRQTNWYPAVPRHCLESLHIVDIVHTRHNSSKLRGSLADSILLHKRWIMYSGPCRV